MLIFFSVCAGIIYMFWYYGRDLPDFETLHNYQPPTVSRIYAGDGALADEFGTHSRVFVPVSNMSPNLINAFVAVEDQRFFEHFGVDLLALSRAMLANVARVLRGQRMLGASTITQQVAKNFLLSNEISVVRKIREAILAVRIERALSKSRILELYLNEIYLGRGAYGIATAALAYFDKSLDDLTIDEMAFLATLPKAPSRYEPSKRPIIALQRRNWALSRMKDEGFLTHATYREAIERPLNAIAYSRRDEVNAPYFVQHARLEMQDLFGKSILDQGGLSVHTSLDPKIQNIARDVLQKGLIEYDRRHGWRGALDHVKIAGQWLERFKLF
ncbi:MAG: transglycosylase domain-containing protein, partial [Pseudomonadota bacterium]